MWKNFEGEKDAVVVVAAAAVQNKRDGDAVDDDVAAKDRTNANEESGSLLPKAIRAKEQQVFVPNCIYY